MLRKVGASQRLLLIPAALFTAGIACGAAPGSASSAPVSSFPLVTIVPADPAPPSAAVASVAPSPAPAPPELAAIAWATSERDARDRARRQNLPLLVYVRADWATACLAMERGAWRDPRVIAEARRFVPLRLDVTAAEGDAELYAERYGVNSIPEIVVVDPAGRTLARSRGAPTTDALVSLLHGVADE